MLALAVLFSLAFAHTRLYSPAPKFYDIPVANFPSECNQIAYPNGSPENNIEKFTAQLNAKFEGSLLKYFTACGSNAPKTEHNAQVSIPTDGFAVIEPDSQHPGLFEFYIDETKVGGGTWQAGQTPNRVPIDYSKCLSGNCKFRYMMAAVHQQPIQLYDNIVTIIGTVGEQESAKKVVKNDYKDYGKTQTPQSAALRKKFDGPCEQFFSRRYQHR